ncbi:MAG: RNase adapter RapZ [Bacillota bacterium]|nr:RNase adapter RapZ [Bacillota bacterium]
MEFIIVSGMSGAGKTRAVAALEDIGFYCVDNMPPALIPRFAEICFQSGGKISKVAFVTDARGANMLDKFFEGLDELKKSGFEYKILFLEASDETLIKRYKETRRKHPLADMYGGSVYAAINAERELLAGIKKQATYILDTSKINSQQLKEYLCEIFSKDTKHSMIITVQSFGFKYGAPADADLVFDVRCFPNPFYIDELKNKTGLDKEVRDYVFGFPETNIFVDKLCDMISFLIPLYMEEGKTSLTIAIGCTGGKHRSTCIAEKLNKYINDNVTYSVITHRDIAK